MTKAKHSMTDILSAFIDDVAAKDLLIWNPDWDLDELKKHGVREDHEGLYTLALEYLEREFPKVYETLEECRAKEGKYETVLDYCLGDTKDKGHSRLAIVNIIALFSGAVTEGEFITTIQANFGTPLKFPFMYDANTKLIEELGHGMFGKEVWRRREEGVVGASKKSGLVLPALGAGILGGVNALLSSAGVSATYDDIRKAITNVDKEVSAARKTAEAYAKEVATRAAEAEELKKIVADLSTKTMLSASVTAEVKSDGTIPDGRVVTKKASEVFPGVALTKDFDLPFWEWDGVHPNVPVADEHYVFRPVELARVLYALVTNQRAYLHGHTGTGKTTLLEQTAARLNWPFLRINFDSEITRMDLIGRDTLKEEDGRTVSKFVDGILPQAMSGPHITCFDELDFVRPDVAYVMQSALEGNALRITEDGDRTVTPHPMYRMFGTGNTVGQGDEHGMYAGARPQSMAFLDRFAIWIEVDYLEKKDRDLLVKRHFPSLTAEQHKQISNYTTEHINSFKDSKVLQPLSPRGMLAIARATVVLGDVSEAVKMTVIDRASGDDKVVLKGIMDRVIK